MFFDVGCCSGSHGELLFCRCAWVLVLFYISIVFDNDGQLRMMNTWMMAENEFERLDDTTSSFTIIILESIYLSNDTSSHSSNNHKKGSNVFKMMGIAILIYLYFMSGVVFKYDGYPKINLKINKRWQDFIMNLNNPTLFPYPQPHP